MTATMRTPTPLTPPVPRLLPTARARLCLLSEGAGTERLDGVWWPRSRSLAREVPALIAAADLRFGWIDRVTVHTGRWPGSPRRIAVAGRTIDVGRFPAREHDVEVCVLSNDAGRWDLLVVPPESEFADAEMSMATATGLLDRPAAQLWLARAVADRTTAEDDAARETAWESEGGPGTATASAVRRTARFPRRPVGRGRWEL
ncbi:DUF5994 family protein [Streptomyces sp. SL13]|uniref:DUF5994 family protein n=1 Tax=Streptantibioticus silvisoli TaxID=2705255 RepID=A0AA90K7C2_9ACTN|nr:DUF5994 family protein [Streptantibioticus silvisoli]MDI5968773.1 DUF5994 family protein [Streptantibioticus silvisoli]